MKVLFAIGTLVIAALCHSAAEARQFTSEILSSDLEKVGLAFPISASFLHFPQQDGYIKNQHCMTTGFEFDSETKNSHERLSHSIKLSFESGKPTIFECLRNNSCLQLSIDKMSGDTQSQFGRFLATGRASNYIINTKHSGPIYSAHQCSSFALEILKNNKTNIEIPTSLWLLNYGNRIVFFNGTTKKIWFTIRLPRQTLVNREHTAAIDTRGNLLISDDSKSLILSPENNFAFIKTKAKIFRTQWGLGSAAYADEWDEYPHSTVASQLNLSDLNHSFMLLTGFVSGNKIINWENFERLLRGVNFTSRTLPGNIATLNEKLSPSGTKTLLATRSDTNTLTLSNYSGVMGEIKIINSAVKVDPRARDKDLILLEDNIYRFTSDGLYKSETQGEYPTSLKGFKGYMKNQIHLFSGKTISGRSCSLKIWSNGNDFFGLLKTQITDISCNQGQGLAASPWSFSATGIAAGNKITSVVTATD